MNESVIKNIGRQWDLWAGPFRAYFPTDKQDVDTCHDMMGHPALGEDALLVCCLDSKTSTIAACLYLTDTNHIDQYGDADFSEAVQVIPPASLKQMATFAYLTIHPAHDKSPAVLVLMTHCFVEVLRAGGQAVLMSCDPEHFSLYKRLGMRPIGPLKQLSNGAYRIPMIGLPDGDYLSVIHSPTLPMLRGIDFERYEELCNWYHHLVRDNSELRVSSAFYPSDEEDFKGHHLITEGLSAHGQSAFLKQAMIINCKEGEVLITENDGGKAFGYIRSGLVKVVIGNKTVVLLGEGDIFGEIAFILHTKRTAQVVAASANTEVVLFNERAINSLQDEKDKTTIWQNLAKVLAQRVVFTNQLLSQ
jgi:hypothetical protein